jgi:hypothetical protein
MKAGQQAGRVIRNGAAHHLYVGPLSKRHHNIRCSLIFGIPVYQFPEVRGPQANE